MGVSCDLSHAARNTFGDQLKGSHLRVTILSALYQSRVIFRPVSVQSVAFPLSLGGLRDMLQGNEGLARAARDEQRMTPWPTA
jgi:hypothetical protein